MVDHVTYFMEKKINRQSKHLKRKLNIFQNIDKKKQSEGVIKQFVNDLILHTCESFRMEYYGILIEGLD